MNNYESVKLGLEESPKLWLITGVAGFIGSNLLETLLSLNQRVYGLDNFSSGHQHNLELVRAAVSPEQWANFLMTEGDIKDIATCRQVCEGVDYVLHQAALGSVPQSIEDPILTNQSNISGFVNMMVAARDHGVQRFVYAASSATYGNDPQIPKTEDMRAQPLSPYAVTKYVNELYADVFAKSYGFNTIGLRYFNIFGPRQDPDGAYAAVIPKWFASMVKKEDIFINGTGETSRDFCYIDNTVQANILAACVENEKALNQVYNIALGERIDLNELFEMIKVRVARVMPEAASLVPTYRDFRAADVLHSQADISKAVTLLGFDPGYSVEGGLDAAAQWYIENLG